jgi:hypothetical protein
MITSFKIDMQGFGFICCSPFATNTISEGEDYLATNFEDPSEVEKHAKECSIVGVSTGSPGTFNFQVYENYPTSDTIDLFEYRLRLGVEVRDNIFQIRDLFDLIDWTKDCPQEQKLTLENGFYHITLLSNTPDSGVLGDDQEILMFLNKLESKPEINISGVPSLC